MKHDALMTDCREIRRFLLSGKAKFTLVSLRTGTRFTYHIREVRGTEPLVLQVGVLTGPDNGHDFTRIGKLYPNSGLEPGVRPRAGTWWVEDRRDAPYSRGLKWFLCRMTRNNVFPSAQLEFWHSGECGRCGRVLTDPTSIAAGLGPTCRQAASQH